MNTETTPAAYKPITENPVPELLPEQIAEFTLESVHAQKLSSFDPKDAVETLVAKEGQRVIGADFGGDKGLSQLFVVRDGRLVIDEAYTDYVQGSNGDGYLASLEKTNAFALAHNIPVGISWGAPLEGTKPLYHPKAKTFLAELAEKYDGDIANIASVTACMNDGSAGLISAAVEANRTEATPNVLFPINGGGLGMAVLHNNVMYAAEAGHVRGVDGLNTYNQTTPCGVFDAEYVCIERLGANKAGIEAQWEAINGSYMRARDIEDQYKAGNILAGELYDHSALVVAHLIAGTATAFGIDITDDSTAIVCHGGAFKFPYYGERIVQILSQEYAGQSPRFIMTKDYGDTQSNACLDGAAMAALVS